MGWSHLLVALRSRPTGLHFDPERVEYYAPAGENAARVAVDRTAADAPGVDATPRTVLWGHLHLVDRVPVENRFLTFGGELRIAPVAGDLTVIDIRSPAPIAAWGGHSQGAGDLAAAIGAFFGRLIVPIDFVPGTEARVDAASPGVLYRAFLADALRRASAERRRSDRSGFAGWLAAAWARARTDDDACNEAQHLLRSLAHR